MDTESVMASEDSLADLQGKNVCGMSRFIGSCTRLNRWMDLMFTAFIGLYAIGVFTSFTLYKTGSNG
jgi:hypothetical protein